MGGWGDFNVCRYENERHNCVTRSRAMRGFSEIIQDLGIIDLPLQGAYYTWSRGEDLYQASRIDRFLISPEWNECFKVVKQVALPRVILDHKPLLLENGDWKMNPSYFKFENMWLQVDGFMKKIEEWWGSYDLNGSPDFILTQKLRLLKKDITIWNKEVFGKVEIRKSKILDELMELEQLTENRVQSMEETSKMLALKLELEQLVRAEGVSWTRKSRCLWLKEGDKNTKFFQRIANSHRISNCIDRLMLDS